MIIVPISDAAASGTNSPAASSAPPTASESPAAVAFRRPGRSPSDSNPAAVFSIPPPPNQPNSFCVP